MNILAISTLFPTPDMPNHGVFVFNRLNAMAQEEGVNVVVISPIPWSPIHNVLKKYRGTKSCPQYREAGALKIHHPRFGSIPGAFKSLEATTLSSALKNKALELIIGNGYEFDRIDVHWTYPDLPAALELAEFLGVPCSVTLRGMEAFYINQGRHRETHIQNSLRKVDHVISLSQEMADYADKISGTRDATRVIRNGVDTETFTYMPIFDAREALKLAQDESIILSVGGLIERKGFHHVIQAMTILTKNNPELNFHYYIIGSTGLEGDFFRSLKLLVSDAGLEERIHFVGQVDNSVLPVWYNAANLFCLPSFGEGSPNVLTEAISCGCQAVAAEVGSVKEIMLSESDLGLTVPNQKDAKNSDAASVWASAIERAFFHQRDREIISAKMKKYTWQRCAKEVIAMLKPTR